MTSDAERKEFISGADKIMDGLKDALEMADFLDGIKFPKGTVLRGTKEGMEVRIPGRRVIRLVPTDERLD